MDVCEQVVLSDDLPLDGDQGWQQFPMSAFFRTTPLGKTRWQSGRLCVQLSGHLALKALRPSLVCPSTLTLCCKIQTSMTRFRCDHTGLTWSSELTMMTLQYAVGYVLKACELTCLAHTGILMCAGITSCVNYSFVE